MALITAEELRMLAFILAGAVLLSLLFAALLLLLAVRQLRKIHIPSDADFIDTIRVTPLFVVVGIDLLDLSLDVLSAPLVWVILDRMGLKALRGISVVQAAIPATQFLPVMTLCWLGVRLLRIR